MEEQTTSSRALHLPALRCAIGDWTYYSATMRIVDIVERVKSAKDLADTWRDNHDPKRGLLDRRVAKISNYLVQRKERFFSSLVVSVGGGTPKWIDLSLVDTEHLTVDSLSGCELVRINKALGVIQLAGDETLTVVDGQLRLAGLRKALSKSPSLGDEVLSVLLVADRGTEYSWRLSTTINRHAQKITPGERVVLDEDDGLAIVTRRLIHQHPFLKIKDLVSSPKSSSLGKTSNHFTTPLAIYKICEILTLNSAYGQALGDGSTIWDRKTLTNSDRPSDMVIDKIFELSSDYWTNVSELVRVDAVSTSRAEGKLITLPVGQMSFARAVRLLADREPVSSQAINESWLEIRNGLPKQLLNVQHPIWSNVLWNPVNGSMVIGVRQQKLAARLLCHYAAGFGRFAEEFDLIAEYKAVVGDPDATLPSRSSLSP